jgi:hypothetical protein
MKIKDCLGEISKININMFNGGQGSPKVNWWEKQIFNETRLYESLGKEDARSVLCIWRRYKETIAMLRMIESRRRPRHKPFPK